MQNSQSVFICVYLWSIKMPWWGSEQSSPPAECNSALHAALVLFEVGLADGFGGYGFADEAGEEDYGEDVG